MGFFEEIPKFEDPHNLYSWLKGQDDIRQAGGLNNFINQRSRATHGSTFNQQSSTLSSVVSRTKTNFGKFMRNTRAGRALGKTKRVLGGAGRLAGPAMGVAMIGMPWFGEGTIKEKARGSAAGAFSFAGMYAGAAVGTAAFGPFGGIIGGIIGGIAGPEALHEMWDKADFIAARGRRMRTQQGWYGDTAAFDTQKAVTMRQASLQMMNQGNMSARSGLGHEGVMIHK